MSYILDALKKSERERALENISTLSPVSPAQLQPNNQRSYWWVSLGVLALVALLVWKFQTPLQQIAHDYLRDAKDIVSNIGLPDFSPEPKEIEQTPKKLVTTPTEISEEEKELIEEPASSESQVTQQPVTAITEEKIVKPKVQTEDSTLEPLPEVTSIENNNEIVPQATPQSVNETFGNITTVVPEEEPVILSLNLAPEAVRQKLAALTLSVVSFTKDEERRFVLVNDQMYREGDGLPGGAIVEKITRDGMIVASNDVKVLLRP
ncbi:MAG: general secretion pathway protein GspB [Gammaproteobacteria bacterium]|nr:general secretion pathway protein GspB [Gammaproteobacteria bacterium]